MQKEKPKRQSVYFAKINRELTLDFISLADDEWIEEKFTQEQINEVFTTPNKENMQVALALFWKSLDLDSKRFIRDAKIILVGDDGSEKMFESDNQVERLKTMITGGNEILQIMAAWINTRKNSNPNAEDNAKKKVMETESSVTSKSLKSSPPSMASQKKNSKSSAEEKSMS